MSAATTPAGLSSRVLLTVAVVATLGVVAHSFFFEMDAWVALKGWSAIDFTNSVLYTDQYARDYAGGGRFIGKSLLPWIYPMAASIGVDPEFTVYLMIWLEVAAVVTAAIFLYSTLFQCVGIAIPICIACVFAFNWGHSINLANLGVPFFVGQYYGFADALRLTAIALVLRGRVGAASGALALCFSFHPIKALIGAAFILPLGLLGNSLDAKVRLLGFGTLFALFAGIWSVMWVGLGSGATEHIASDEFIAHARLLNSHWFPQDIGVLGARHERHLTPFLSFLVFALIALARAPLSARTRAQVLWGIVGLLLLTMVGLCSALLMVGPTIIKMNLQRATILIVSVGTLSIIGSMAHGMRNGQWLPVCLEAAFLSSGFWSHQPYPEALAAIYFLLFVRSSTGKETPLPHSMMIFGSAAAIVGKSLWFALLPEHGGQTFFTGVEWAVVALAAAAILIAVSKTWGKRLQASGILVGLAPYTVAVVFATQAVCWSLEFKQLPDQLVAQGHAYREVQAWARSETPVESLFMVDPCTAYGWRDFSQRSSFGTFSEWLKTAWLYSGDLALFEEGLVRARALGIDLKPYLGHSSAPFGVLCEAARSRYYDATGGTLQALAGNFAIDYFVLDRSKVPETGLPPEFAIAFSNDRYVVLQPPPGE